MRKNWDGVQSKIRELEGRLGASHAIISDVSNECDSLRHLLSTREAQIQNDEQATLEQMRSIYEEITSLVSGKDGMDANASNLFKKFGQVTKQGTEVLAKRAFVSGFFSLLFLEIGSFPVMSPCHLPFSLPGQAKRCVTDASMPLSSC